MNLEFGRGELFKTELASVIVIFFYCIPYRRLYGSHTKCLYWTNLLLHIMIEVSTCTFKIMAVKSCTKCGACFVDGVFRWAYSGKRGDPKDLAGLVCRPLGDSSCINPMRDVPGGDTFAKRTQFIQDHPFGV